MAALTGEVSIHLIGPDYGSDYLELPRLFNIAEAVPVSVRAPAMLAFTQGMCSLCGLSITDTVGLAEHVHKVFRAAPASAHPLSTLGIRVPRYDVATFVRRYLNELGLLHGPVHGQFFHRACALWSSGSCTMRNEFGMVDFCPRAMRSILARARTTRCAICLELGAVVRCSSFNTSPPSAKVDVALGRVRGRGQARGRGRGRGRGRKQLSHPSESHRCTAMAHFPCALAHPSWRLRTRPEFRDVRVVCPIHRTSGVAPGSLSTSSGGDTTVEPGGPAEDARAKAVESWLIELGEQNVEKAGCEGPNVGTEQIFGTDIAVFARGNASAEAAATRIGQDDKEVVCAAVTADDGSAACAAAPSAATLKRIKATLTCHVSQRTLPVVPYYKGLYGALIDAVRDGVGPLSEIDSSSVVDSSDVVGSERASCGDVLGDKSKEGACGGNYVEGKTRKTHATHYASAELRVVVGEWLDGLLHHSWGACDPIDNADCVAAIPTPSLVADTSRARSLPAGLLTCSHSEIHRQTVPEVLVQKLETDVIEINDEPKAHAESDERPLVSATAIVFAAAEESTGAESNVLTDSSGRDAAAAVTAMTDMNVTSEAHESY